MAPSSAEKQSTQVAEERVIYILGVKEAANNREAILCLPFQ